MGEAAERNGGFIANIKNPDKRAGQGAGPYRRFVGAAALGGPLASILKIAIGKKELHRSFRKIDPEKLKAYVAEHPDAYQREMAEVFACSESGIDTYLYREYGYTPQGQRVFGQIHGRKYQRCGIAAAPKNGYFLLPKMQDAEFCFFPRTLWNSIPLRTSGPG